MNRKKVVIGMSGGVDSSVAAALLKEKGYEVIGLTMRLFNGETSLPDAEDDAKRICETLGIEHRVVDFTKEFEKYVIDYFTNEYRAGRTPNPCIVCNKHLKFDAMLKAAKELGADYIATGHYAKIEFNEEKGRYLLKRAASEKKDQTYALFSLSQRQLSKTLMPLGELGNKEETRKIAEKLGLVTANKPDSMEICFIPDNDYVSFIEKRTNIKMPKGNFVDTEGNVLGQHNGIINYTIGQRKGLGVTFGKPMFVIKIDSETNNVTLGEKGCEFSKELFAKKLNFIPFETLEEPIRVKAKIRYSAKEADALVIPENDGARVLFDVPQRAVTPGQAVVFYDTDGNACIGGGIIE